MKKFAALILAVLMVVTLIPAMALISSAAPVTLELGKYGDGAETWNNTSFGEVISQFLVTYEESEGSPKVKDIMSAIGYTAAKKGEDGTIAPATATSGYFKLTITDDKGKSTVIDKFVPRTVYDAGSWIIWRFDTCENGFVFEDGVTYSMKVEIVVGNAVKYQGTAEDLFWTAGKWPTDKIYKAGKPADGSDPDENKPKPATGYPVKGIEFSRYFGNDGDTMKTDWEPQGDIPCLLVMVPKEKVLTEDDVQPGALKGTVDLGNGTVLNCELHSNYNFSESWLLRLKTDSVPAAGKAFNAKITLNGTDGKLKYQGTCLISNGGTTEDNVDTGNGDTPVTPKTGDTVIYATVAMAVALVGMAVVVKKVRG